MEISGGDSTSTRPLKGAAEFSPWRKPWENVPPELYSAMEGRKMALPDVPVCGCTLTSHEVQFMRHRSLPVQVAWPRDACSFHTCHLFWD